MPDVPDTSVPVATMAAGLDEHVAVVTAARGLLPALADVESAIRRSLSSGGRLYTFGNGGSAADAQHFATELAGRYRRNRAPLPATALTVDGTLLTCVGNDFSFEAIFERQVHAHVRPGDVVAAFSTSGRSPNVRRGLAAASEVGATTILFTGAEGEGALGEADLAVVVPSVVTARIQEVHGLCIHLVSDALDAWAAER